jgi:hypothetical protein
MATTAVEDPKTRSDLARIACAGPICSVRKELRALR